MKYRRLLALRLDLLQLLRRWSPYFPLILVFCQRWQKDFGIGSLAATPMLPLFAAATGLRAGHMAVIWVVLEYYLGPTGAAVEFSLPIKS